MSDMQNMKPAEESECRVTVSFSKHKAVAATSHQESSRNRNRLDLQTGAAVLEGFCKRDAVAHQPRFSEKPSSSAL